MLEDILKLGGTVFGMLGGTSIIGGLILRRIDKLEKKLELRERDRIDEAVLTESCISACERLSVANTEAIRSIDDENACEAELHEVKNARERMNEFVLTKSAQYLHAR